jgi:hypothetical protein
MPTKKWIAELRLMIRGTFALLYKRVSIEPLVNADHELDLSNNVQLAASPPATREEYRKHSRDNVIQRLSALRRRLAFSFIFLFSAAIIAFLLTGCPHGKAWVGVASVFAFAWSTLARLTERSWSGKAVIERLDTNIFLFLYWIGMLLGTVALS